MSDTATMPSARIERARKRKPLPWERCAGKEDYEPTRLAAKILAVLDYYGLADANHIAAILGGNADWVVRTLHDLFDAGYVDRPAAQFVGLAPGAQDAQPFGYAPLW